MSEGLEPSGEAIKKSGTRDAIVLLIRVGEIILKMEDKTTFCSQKTRLDVGNVIQIKGRE